jgi:hypothetical protein|eukprot:SAG25_NODE_85_length_16527_cov_73.409240_5_plen_103_part_00
MRHVGHGTSMYCLYICGTKLWWHTRILSYSYKWLIWTLHSPPSHIQDGKCIKTRLKAACDTPVIGVSQYWCVTGRHYENGGAQLGGIGLTHLKLAGPSGSDW